MGWGACDRFGDRQVLCNIRISPPRAGRPNIISSAWSQSIENTFLCLVVNRKPWQKRWCFHSSGTFTAIFGSTKPLRGDQDQTWPQGWGSTFSKLTKFLFWGTFSSKVPRQKELSSSNKELFPNPAYTKHLFCLGKASWFTNILDDLNQISLSWLTSLIMISFPHSR